MPKSPQFALDVRTELGLTQMDLAQYLGISRSSLARFESGIRSMPREARDRMVQLNASAAERKKIQPAPVSPAERERYIKVWSRQLKKDQHLLMNAQARLNEYEIRYRQVLLCHSRLGIIQPQSDRERRWIKRVQRRHEQDMARFGPLAQTDLRLLIAGYEARIAVLNEVLEKAV